MKIERIEVVPFGIPIRKFADAYTGFSVSNAVLVKMYTDDGHIGYGEDPRNINKVCNYYRCE